ncbi:MAG: hypothetical protein RRZ73_05070 [Oscillospiraceae bacterium]
MTDDSFSFGKFNSVDDWGIKVIAHDFLMPPKRDRRIQIPFKSGSYSYSGVPLYDDRSLVIDCILERQISKTQLRQIAYELSQRKEIRLWNEPYIYYVGEIYSTAEVTDFAQESMREFTLEFVCEPFAYSDLKKLNVSSGDNKIKYNGTAETPTVIILKNNNSFDVSNIQITLVRKES